MFDRVPLSAIRPATYNPRRIGAAQFEELKNSLKLIGCVLPVIVNKANGVIIAGHQRCKALKAIGSADVPVAYVDGITIADEMTFNQMHNGTELRARGQQTYSGNASEECFVELKSDEFSIDGVSGTALKEICRLLTRYGNVLSCVICSGRVYLGGAYVKACALLGLPVNGYICDIRKKRHLDKYFAQNYGEYSYDCIERHTYLQGLAQLQRNVEMKNGIKKQYASKTYCDGVIPYLKSRHASVSILDFGCGKGAYIQHLKRLGYNAVGVEFYNNNRVSIDVAKGNSQIDELCAHLRAKGRFDVVVCDSVLNSVDSMEAERSVLRCLNGFCKLGGALFISGRPIEDAHMHNESRKSSERKNFITFLDADGFTAKFRNGGWYFQKYHSLDTFKRSIGEARLEIEQYTNNKSSFWARCTKAAELTQDEIASAIEFEFNLPLPHGKSYNRHADVMAALEEAL